MGRLPGTVRAAGGGARRLGAFRAAGAVAVSAAVLVAGCTATPLSGDGTLTRQPTQGGGPVPNTGVTVGLALDVGGRADHSYNATAGDGADRGALDFGVTILEESAAKTDNKGVRQARLERLIAQGGTSIIAVGNAYREAVLAVARAHPKVRFALVDAVPVTAPNVLNVTFADEQGSYLVGVAAALKTKTNRVGFVGGVQSSVVEAFQAGFTAGAKAVNPSIAVDTAYLGVFPDGSGFQSAAAARAAAGRMYSAGADIVFHAAGGSGSGVFDAAVAAHAWAIGVDSDQYLTVAPEVQQAILTSMVKRLDVAVYFVIKSIAEGAFTPGVERFDLKSGGVDYATSGGRVDDIKATLEDYREKIIAGQIVVPTVPSKPTTTTR